MNHTIANYQGASQEIKLNCLKFYQWAASNNLKSFRMVIADSDYYKKTYEQRRDILGAPSIEYLCKTIVFANTSYDQKYKGQYYPKYIAVIVQYIAKINTQKLNKLIRLWQQKHSPDNKASKSYFHYRLAEDQSDNLTGYTHNSVVPIFLKTRMPVIVSNRLQELEPKFFWMGGGHPDVKMRLSLDQFTNIYQDKVLVQDITYNDD